MYVYLYVSLDAHLFKSILEHFVIRDEFVIVSGFPVDLGHGHLARVYSVYDLTIYGSRSKLLDFSYIELCGKEYTLRRSLIHAMMSVLGTK